MERSTHLQKRGSLETRIAVESPIQRKLHGDESLFRLEISIDADTDAAHDLDQKHTNYFVERFPYPEEH